MFSSSLSWYHPTKAFQKCFGRLTDYTSSFSPKTPLITTTSAPVDVTVRINQPLKLQRERERGKISVKLRMRCYFLILSKLQTLPQLHVNTLSEAGVCSYAAALHRPRVHPELFHRLRTDRSMKFKQIPKVFKRR